MIRSRSAPVSLSDPKVSVQGFPSLAFVADELEGIRNIYGGAILRNRSFLIPNMEKELKDEHFSIVHIASHGKFAGKPKNVAVLRFSKHISRWVSNAQWHPKQKGGFVDGEYELEVPYSDPRELILDILRYGPDVHVKSPTSLKNIVAKRLEKAANQYKNSSC